jgi:hypothetical protein
VERCTYHSKAEKPCYAMVLSREREHVSSVRCLPYTQISRIESSLQPPEKLLPTIDIYCWSRPAATHPTHQVPSSSEPSSSTSPSLERTYPEGRFGSRFRFFSNGPHSVPVCCVGLPRLLAPQRRWSGVTGTRGCRDIGEFPCEVPGTLARPTYPILPGKCCPPLRKPPVRPSHHVPWVAGLLGGPEQVV